MEKAVIVLNLLLGNGSIVFVYACVDPRKAICLVGFGLVLVTGREEKGQNRVIYCVCVFEGDKKGLGCPGFVSKSQIDGCPDGRRTREAGRRVDPGLAGVR